jgi:hypothetical protein
MTNQQGAPEALRLADAIKASGQFTNLHTLDEASAELRRQHARITELEAELEAAGAGGVSGPLMGRASLSANAGEPRKVFLVATGEEHEGEATYTRYDDKPPPLCDSECLFAAPPTAQAEGWTATAQHQTYRCKIKSRKQIDKEIPRDQQGWWADVAAGQKLLLRPAVQADIDRCHLGGRRSKNPDDYMCETQTNGSLVSKIALEYMHPEQNVFAAVPPLPTSAEGLEHG